MKVGFSVDNPQRDLRGILLIANHLISQGHKVYLIPMYSLSFDIFLLNLDVMIFNYLRPNNRKLVKKIHSLGVETYILDTEGGVVSSKGLDSPNKWAKSFKDSGYRDFIDGYFFWGNRLFEAFREISGMNPDKIHLTGCPRYDQCSPKYSSLIQAKNKDHILINTNFSSINPKFSKDRESEKKIFKSTGWGEEYSNKIYDETEKVFLKFLNEIKEIAHELPSEKFILRPHPFENKSLYKNFYKDFENITIDSEGEIFDAISGAKYVIHLNCGSSVDAFFMGVSSISIEYLNTPFLKSHAPLPSEISIPAENRKNLIEIIKKGFYFSENKKNKLFNEFIEPFFFFNDGNSSQRVSNVINKSKKNIKMNNSINFKVKDIFFDSNLKSFYFKFFSLIFGSFAAFKIKVFFNPSLKNKELKRGEIMNSIYGLEGNKNKVKVSKTKHSKLLNLSSFEIKNE
tara:strand:- start:12347 stop:13714 length:1368 start_codon:yes stop_codon:yes gene_type:complete